MLYRPKPRGDEDQSKELAERDLSGVPAGAVPTAEQIENAKRKNALGDRLKFWNGFLHGNLPMLSTSPLNPEKPQAY